MRVVAHEGRRARAPAHKLAVAVVEAAKPVVQLLGRMPPCAAGQARPAAYSPRVNTACRGPAPS